MTRATATPTTSTVTALRPVARALRAVMAQRPCDELTALCRLAQENPVLYERFSRTIRRDAALAQMSLSEFAGRCDSLKTAGTIAA